jgi:hypothetical protein
MPGTWLLDRQARTWHQALSCSPPWVTNMLGSRMAAARGGAEADSAAVPDASCGSGHAGAEAAGASPLSGPRDDEARRPLISQAPTAMTGRSGSSSSSSHCALPMRPGVRRAQTTTERLDRLKAGQRRPAPSAHGPVCT